MGPLGPEGTYWWRAVQVEGSNETQKQLVVPRGLIETVLELLHESKLSGGPFVFQKNLDRARQRSWRPIKRKDIQRKCENCTLCQSRSAAGKIKIAPFQTINVGIRFSKVAADIIGSFTKRCKIHSRIDRLFQEIRGFRSPAKSYCRLCCKSNCREKGFDVWSTSLPSHRQRSKFMQRTATRRLQNSWNR